MLALADQDVARGLTIRLDGRPIAFSLYLQLAGRSYGMNMAFDPAYAQYGPGSEAKLQAIEASWSEGIRRIELLGTAAEHKRRFTDRFEPVYEGIGLARTRRGRAATEALLAGIRLRRALKRSKTARALRRALSTRMRHEKGGPQQPALPSALRFMPETALPSGCDGSRCPYRPPAAGVRDRTRSRRTG